jgi:hypothetical protein
MWKNIESKNKELKSLFKNITHVYTSAILQKQNFWNVLSVIQRSQIQILASNKSILQLKTELKGKEGNHP